MEANVQVWMFIGQGLLTVLLGLALFLLNGMRAQISKLQEAQQAINNTVFRDYMPRPDALELHRQNRDDVHALREGLHAHVVKVAILERLMQMAHPNMASHLKGE